MPNSDISTSPRDGSHVFDDFFANSGVADATVGQLNWEMTTIANASVPSFVASQNGIMRITTLGTSGDGEAFTLEPDGVTLGGTNQEFWFRVRYPSISGNVIAANNFRIGVDDSVTVTDPTVGIEVKSLAGVLTLRSDSADHGDVSSAITGVSTLTSGTTAVIDTWHDVLVTWEGANGQGGPRFIECFVDGELGASVFCNIDDDEEVELKITHWNTSGATLELDLDYYEFWQWR